MKLTQLLEAVETPSPSRLSSAIRYAYKESIRMLHHPAQHQKINSHDYKFRNKVTWSELESNRVRITAPSKNGDFFESGILLSVKDHPDGGTTLTISGHIKDTHEFYFKKKSDCRNMLNSVIPLDEVFSWTYQKEKRSVDAVFAIPKDIHVETEEGKAHDEFMEWYKPLAAFSGVQSSRLAGKIQVKDGVHVINHNVHLDFKGKPASFPFKMNVKSLRIGQASFDTLENLPIVSDLSFVKCEIKATKGLSASKTTFYDCKIDSVKDIVDHVNHLSFARCTFKDNPLDHLPQYLTYLTLDMCKNTPTSLAGIQKKLPQHCKNFAMSGVTEAILDLYKMDVNLDFYYSQLSGITKSGDLQKAIKLLLLCKRTNKSIVQAQRELIDHNLEDFA